MARGTSASCNLENEFSGDFEMWLKLMVVRLPIGAKRVNELEVVTYKRNTHTFEKLKPLYYSFIGTWCTGHWNPFNS
jgi:hypothetical protein